MSVVKRLAPEPGLRVLVSAGASGIGAAIAGAFHEAGAKIHVCDISHEAMESFQARFPDAVVTPRLDEPGDVDAVGDRAGDLRAVVAPGRLAARAPVVAVEGVVGAATAGVGGEHQYQ